MPGTGPVEIQPLGSGLVNDGWRVSRAGRRYFLRAASSNSQVLGLDRGWELRVLAAAGQAGVAPVLVAGDSASGILVAEWRAGRAWSSHETRLEENVQAMAGLLRRVHALPMVEPKRTMNPAAWLAHYAEVFARRATAIPPRLARLGCVATTQLDRLADLGPTGTVLCHGDLHTLNVLVEDGAPSGNRLVLLDWEYAHYSDPFWDVAGWAVNNDWTAPAPDALLARYLERQGTAAERRRLDLLMWL